MQFSYWVSCSKTIVSLRFVSWLQLFYSCQKNTVQWIAKFLYKRLFWFRIFLENYLIIQFIFEILWLNDFRSRIRLSCLFFFARPQFTWWISIVEINALSHFEFWRLLVNESLSKKPCSCFENPSLIKLTMRIWASCSDSVWNATV